LTTAKLNPKIKRIGILDIKEYGPEPEWRENKILSDRQYLNKTAKAVHWYYNIYSKKEGKEFFIAWLNNNFPKKHKLMLVLSKAKPDYFSNLLCALYLLENKGWQRRFCILRHVVKHINEIHLALNKELSVDTEPQENAETISIQPNIQERIRDQAVRMSDFIDAAIDDFIINPNQWDSSNYKVASGLRTSGAKAVHARYIKGFFLKGLLELQELSSGNASDQLKEAYKHLPRKNVKKLLDFYQSIQDSCDQLIGESKIARKPRNKKIKPADELVKKIKFLSSFDKLAVSSIPPVSIIGASSLVVYNVRTRKIGYYIAKSSSGLTVKGAVLDNYSEKSIQKTLRKPEEQLKKFKELNTQKRFENWFSREVTTTDTILSGRFNEDTILLKVYK
jgi:hypothetical protein